MIWGKTYIQKKEREQEKNNNWFAWYPIHLENGKWCWLQKVKKVFWGNWSSCGYDYFLKQKE